MAEDQYVAIARCSETLKTRQRPIFEEVLVHAPRTAVHQSKPLAVGVKPDLGVERSEERLPVRRHRLFGPTERYVPEALLFGIAVGASTFVPIEADAIVVVSNDCRNGVLPDPVDHYVWKRRVPDQVAETIRPLDVLMLQVVEHGFQRRDVRVDVTDDGNSHGSSPATCSEASCVRGTITRSATAGSACVSH